MLPAAVPEGAKSARVRAGVVIALAPAAHTAMLEKYEVCCGLFRGFDYASVLKGSSAQKLTGVAAAMDYILGLDDGKKRLLEAVGVLTDSHPAEAILLLLTFRALRA